MVSVSLSMLVRKILMTTYQRSFKGVPGLDHCCRIIKQYNKHCSFCYELQEERGKKTVIASSKEVHNSLINKIFGELLRQKTCCGLHDPD